MYTIPPKNIPEREEVKRMIRELSNILPMTNEQVLFRAVQKYYEQKIYKLRAKTSGDWTRMKVQLILEQHHECYYCHRYISYRLATLDHKIPTGRGGGNEYDNLCACCEPCNLEKDVMTEDEFLSSKLSTIPVLT